MGLFSTWAARCRPSLACGHQKLIYLSASFPKHPLKAQRIWFLQLWSVTPLWKRIIVVILMGWMAESRAVWGVWIAVLYLYGILEVETGCEWALLYKHFPFGDEVKGERLQIHIQQVFIIKIGFIKAGIWDTHSSSWQTSFARGLSGCQSSWAFFGMLW